MTCGSWQEAQRIADELLQKYLVGRVEFLEVDVQQWRDSGTREIKLVMETLAQKLESIEQAVVSVLGKETAIFQQTSLPHSFTPTLTLPKPV